MSDIEKRGQMPENEVRFVTTEPLKIVKRDKHDPDEDEDLGRIEGRAVIFDTFTDLGWFKEKINRNAFDGVDLSNVVGTFNHNFDNVLGKTSKSTMRLSIDDRGLNYSIDIPNTTIGRDLAENVNNGNVDGASFMFSIKEQIWTDREGDIDEREITKIDRLFELGPVTMPAYPDTTAAKRSHDAQIPNHKTNKKYELRLRLSKI